ncbi:MAG: LruC domain-containing protein [Bacteroidetes bacterium]|nr:LruC domain-containing protein [Bacteroidota bacterium]
MKPFSRLSLYLITLILFAGSVIIISGCKRHYDVVPTTPTHFTDLKIDPAFQFDNFINLDATIKVGNPGQQSLFVIQIFQGDPSLDGKLIATGATDNTLQYKTKLRVPSRLKELWVGKISLTGISEYKAVPISGTTFSYTFGTKGTKSTEETESNDCNTGTPITTNGTYTINSGQVYVVQQGVNLTSLVVTINAGGTLRVCGTANITDLNSGTGTLIVSPSGSLTLPAANTYADIENYGTANFAQSGNNKTFNIMAGSIVHNWGILTFSNGLNVKGQLINEYHTTVCEDAQTQVDGVIINNCQMFINSNKNTALQIVTGTLAVPGFVNGPNAYLKVIGVTNFTGQGYGSLGLQSLIETGTFSIQGTVTGPVSQGSQIHATASDKSSISSAASLTGYIDLWASSINPNNGTYGPNITFHNPGYTISMQDCSAPQPPVITSSLTAAGIVGTAVTPYVITATGTAPITYNATNLPAGLNYNATTHTISGTPTTAGVVNVTLTANNLVGIDTKTLVYTITVPGSPPVITSALTASATVNQPFSYVITASGTGTITYNATSLPAGLTFNATTHTISGTPTAAGTYSIPISATNSWGSDNKTLVLTVGTPPTITSALTATGTVGQQFSTYTVTGTGSSPITYNATNLPLGLSFNASTNTINGTPTAQGVTNVTLTANNPYGNDSKILVITINAGVQPPLITSPLTAAGTVNQSFSYTVTASGTTPITYTATNLPAGLSFDPSTHVISGIPTTAGTTNVPLTATNSGGVDNKTLVITIVNPAPTDTDGDGVPDNLDAYPTDPTRAFNSYYPNQTDFATYAFEDLWPAYGDYDCNDLVVNFNYKIVTNAQNKVVDLISTYKIKAAGAYYNNGFGVALSTAPSNVASVTGCIKVGSVVVIDPKGYEAGHTTETVIIPVDAVNTLLGGIIINTVHGGYTVQTQTQTVTVHLSTPQTSIGTPPYNPFIFVNQDRGHEVHLKDHSPTELNNPVYFGSLNDGSVPAQGLYYRSTSGLPWAFEIPVDFNYPIEKADIIQTYLHFAAWAQSSGASYTDWYMDKPGYRNAVNIY